MERKEMLKRVKRVVVKVGTSTLTHPTGHMNFNQIDLLTRQLADMQNQGYEVILVTSGAIGAGVGKLNLKEKPRLSLKSRPLRRSARGCSCTSMRNSSVSMERSLGRSW